MADPSLTYLRRFRKPLGGDFPLCGEESSGLSPSRRLAACRPLQERGPPRFGRGPRLDQGPDVPDEIRQLRLVEGDVARLQVALAVSEEIISVHGVCFQW